MPEMVLSMDQQSELCDHSIIVATKKELYATLL